MKYRAVMNYTTLRAFLDLFFGNEGIESSRVTMVEIHTLASSTLEVTLTCKDSAFEYFLEHSFEDGLLHYYGYSKIFNRVTETAG